MTWSITEYMRPSVRLWHSCSSWLVSHPNNMDKSIGMHINLHSAVFVFLSQDINGCLQDINGCFEADMCSVALPCLKG